MQEIAEQIAQRIQNAAYPIILTGANLVKEQGIPDFRTAKPNSCTGCSTDHQCSQSCESEETYRVALSLLQTIQNIRPSDFYHLLSQLEQLKIVKAIITENVDSLHHLAGSQKIFELAGNLRQTICQSCHRQAPISLLIDKIKAKEIPPLCQCGGILLPNLHKTHQSSELTMLRRELDQADLLVAIGSDLTDTVTKDIVGKTKHLLLINPNPTNFDNQAEILWQENLATILPVLTQAMAEEFCLD